MEIYVVFGSTGEYSDHTYWLIKAYSDEEKAKEHVVLATNEFKARWSKTLGWEGRQKVFPKGWNKYDLEAEQPDYTGNRYWYEGVELD